MIGRREMQRRYGIGRRVAERIARAGVRFLPDGSYYVQHGDQNYVLTKPELADFLESTRGTQVRVHHLKEAS